MDNLFYSTCITGESLKGYMLEVDTASHILHLMGVIKSYNFFNIYIKKEEVSLFLNRAVAINAF